MLMPGQKRLLIFGQVARYVGERISDGREPGRLAPVRREDPLDCLPARIARRWQAPAMRGDRLANGAAGQMLSVERRRFADRVVALGMSPDLTHPGRQQAALDQRLRLPAQVREDRD